MTLRGPARALLLTLAAFAACRNAEPGAFKIGDCVEYVDADGNPPNEEATGQLHRTPMRILGVVTEDKYLVEWTTTYSPTDVQHFKGTTGARSGS